MLLLLQFCYSELSVLPNGPPAIKSECLHVCSKLSMHARIAQAPGAHALRFKATLKLQALAGYGYECTVCVITLSYQTIAHDMFLSAPEPNS